MNQLEVSIQQSIIALASKGWSHRRIARELGIHRETVGRYLAVHKEPNPAIVPTGSTEVHVSKPAIPPLGSAADSISKPAIVPIGSRPGRKSQCEPFAEVIERAWLAGLCAQRIYQDLVSDYQFTGKYDAVKRFVRRFGPGAELPFRRMDSAPGQQLQVDFGTGAWVIEEGKRRRPHLFRCTLAASRKAYSEVVWRQTTESFIRCLENAFRYFGGVTATVVIDNLKAGVIQADWYDPRLNPKLEEFARHYGTVILPTKPVMPRHKGKVEASVKYAQNNALKGRSFDSLTAQNAHLLHWEKTVADTRIHGTTRLQVGKCFEELERPALQPLPASVFPMFEEALRRVHRDGHVEFKRAYYSVPPEYVGRQVWVRQETRLVRLYNHRREQIGLHPLGAPGKFATAAEHIHDHKRNIIERGSEHLLDRCGLIGPFTGTWARAMYEARGPQGMRVMQGLLQLAEQYPADALEKAARTATHHGTWRLADLKRLLQLPSNVTQLDFLETHPLIRSLEAYRIDFNTTQTP